MSSVEPLQQQLNQFRTDFRDLQGAIAGVIVGQQEAIDASLVALVAGGHVLLEGAPGLGKTRLVRTLADAVDLEFRRVQFTPDLMPADVIGTYVVMESQGRRKFEFQQGPIFTNVLLADEINRATPKTQSALLEGLEEGGVSVANETYPLPQPFFVMATQSPLDADGTFPLPKTQLDRFLFTLRMTFPSGEELETILDRTTDSQPAAIKPVLDGKRILEMANLARQVTIAPEVRRYAVDLLLATHPDRETSPPLVRRFVEYGCSPRGAQALVRAAKIRAILEGRAHVAREDLQHFAPAALRHRLTLNYEGHAEGADPDDLVREVLSAASKHAAAP